MAESNPTIPSLTEGPRRRALNACRRVGVVSGLSLEAGTLAASARSARDEGGLRSACGVGRVRASEAAHSLLAAGACALVSWGTAAGLRSGLSAAAVVVPDVVLGADAKRYTADVQWRRRVWNALAGLVTLDPGPLCEVASALRTPGEKRTLLERTGASAADMESAAVGEVALHARVPFLALRAVVDSAGVTVPASAVQALREDGAVDVAYLLGGVLRQPGELVALARLAPGFVAARRALRACARALGPDLGLP